MSGLDFNGFVPRYSPNDKCWFVVSKHSGRIWMRANTSSGAMKAIKPLQTYNLDAVEFDDVEEAFAEGNRQRMIANIIYRNAKRRPR